MNFVKNHCWGLFSIITAIFISVVLNVLASSVPLKSHQLALVSSDANISSMPHIWETNDHIEFRSGLENTTHKKHNSSIQHFTFVAHIESLDTESLALYIPYYQHQITIFINGQQVDDLGFFEEFAGGLLRSSAYILLQKSWFKEGENTVGITVNAGDFIFGGLSNVYLGPAKVLSSRDQINQLFERDFKLLIVGALFLMIITGLVRFYTRPQDKSVAWLALFYSVTCLIGIHVLAKRLPIIDFLTPWSFLLIPVAILSLLAYRQSLNNKVFFKYTVPAIAIYIISLGVLIVGFDVVFKILVFFYAIPLTCILLSLLLFLYAQDTWRNDNPYDGFMLGALIILLIAIFNSAPRQYIGIDTEFSFLQLEKCFILIGLAVLQIKKHTNDANMVDQAATELENQLALKTRELESLFIQQQCLAEKAASAKERQRITADLHDGVAGHLSTMLALIEIGDATNENLNEIANTALTDLRMVIETLSLPEGELRGALAAFRERCVAPLHYLGVDIEWNLIDLPRIEHLNSEQLLSILRLVQEAITNAMKHGKATRFDISGWQPDTTTGCISIANSGGLPLQDYTPGHGIKSMHKRAADIGGTLDIVKTHSGAEVNLRIPILR